MCTAAQVFNNAIQCLSEEDRALPPIEKILPMLQVRTLRVTESTRCQYGIRRILPM